MSKELSETERALLHGLIHDDGDWWACVPNVNERNLALHRLIQLKLVEVHEKRGMRATARGVKSNQLWLESRKRAPRDHLGRASYRSFLGELVHCCDRCGAECARYQAKCRKCGQQLTDVVERTIGPSLDLVALKHHGDIPPDDDNGWEP